MLPCMNWSLSACEAAGIIRPSNQPCLPYHGLPLQSPSACDTLQQNKTSLFCTLLHHNPSGTKMISTTCPRFSFLQHCWIPPVFFIQQQHPASCPGCTFGILLKSLCKDWNQIICLMWRKFCCTSSLLPSNIRLKSFVPEDAMDFKNSSNFSHHLSGTLPMCCCFWFLQWSSLNGGITNMHLLVEK